MISYDHTASLTHVNPASSKAYYKDTSWATPAESCEALEVRGTLWASHSLFHQAMAPESSVPVSGPPSIA